MSRFLPALLLLAAAASVQAMSPSRQGANGDGGTCPETETSIAADEDAGNDEPRPAVAKATPPAPAKGGTGTLVRPKAGARWHSFLPGMFK